MIFKRNDVKNIIEILKILKFKIFGKLWNVLNPTLSETGTN
jgi:hypothetical protein